MMKFGLTAAVALTLLAGGLAQAQTAPGTASPAPNTTTGGGSALGAANPGRIGTTTSPAAVSTTSAPSRTTAAPVPGANSFTEGEARRRIEEKGFGQVAGLKKDDQGIWRGTATKDGKSMAVALDYQGNIVSQ